MDIINSFEIENEIFYYYDLKKVFNGNEKLKKLPIVLKILLEANLRKAKDSIEFNKVLNIFSNRMNSQILLYPSRIIMQDYLGIPSLVDLASMREVLAKNGEDASSLNPKIMVDLVIDNLALNEDSKVEYDEKRKLYKEKCEFAKWAQKSFSNLRVVPPGSGICHQINLEYLSTILHLERKDDKNFIYPETLISTDLNMTMINSLGVLGWGVDAVKVQASMLGNPILLKLPKVLGVNVQGELKEGITSTALVHSLTKILKKCDLEGKLVEFHGEGLKYLTLEDRSVISSLASEYKAICAFFAIDDKTIEYFNKTRGNEDYGHLLKKYLKLQNLFYEDEISLYFDEVLDFELSKLQPSILGGKKLNEKVDIESLKNKVIINSGFELKDDDIVLAIINLCTQSSLNPYILIHAALIAKKASEYGLKVNKRVKTLFTSNSFEKKDVLERLNLIKHFEAIGFDTQGYKCNILSQNSIELDRGVESDIRNNTLNVASVLSGIEKNQETVYPLIKSNYLMSASLVLIYSLVGSTKFDLFNDVIGVIDDKDIKLKDLWPSSKEVGAYLGKLDYTLYKEIYQEVFKGNEFWQKLYVDNNTLFTWDKNSSSIQPAMIFDRLNSEKIELNTAEILALLGDDITTEQISPLGQISLYSPAAKYLENKSIRSFEYHTFRDRRGDAQVMARGTFDGINQNKMVSKEGAYTIDYEEGEIISIYEKSKRAKEKNKPLVVFAGENYGKGKSRDWAAKGIRVLGIKAIIAKSFNDTHRINLVEFGVLPLEFMDDDIDTLKLKGDEIITINTQTIKPQMELLANITRKDGSSLDVELLCRLDNDLEVEYYKSGGVLPYLLKTNK